MVIGATGIVVDHYGDILLIQRDDTRTLAPPGGSFDIGELPPDAVVREVREETGLIVMAVRLVGLSYFPIKPRNYFSLIFRCIMRGGDIQTSEESPRVGFFKTNPLPSPMLDLHVQRIQKSSSHKGGPPFKIVQPISTRIRLGNLLLNSIVYPWLHFRRSRAGLPAYEAPPNWQAKSAVILRNNMGEVLWMKDVRSGGWVLPGTAASETVPPWVTAEQALKKDTGLNIELNNLSGVYPAAGAPEMTFSFTELIDSNAPLSQPDNANFFVPGQEPKGSFSQHTAFVLDAVEKTEETTFRLIS